MQLSDLTSKKPEELNVMCAELCGTARTELGILYPNGTRSFGNSEEYTRQKCANYQRQGLGCELIERRTTDEDYTGSWDAIMPEVRKLTREQRERFVRALNSQHVEEEGATEYDNLFSLAAADPRALTIALIIALS